MSATLAFHYSLIQRRGYRRMHVSIGEDLCVCCTKVGCHNRTYRDIQGK